MPTRSLIAVALVLLPSVAIAQGGSQAPPPLVLPTVIVTAQKEPVDLQKVPASVTAVPAETLWDAKISSVADAALYAPNVWFNEFTARKLSNAFFRGVGSSPANPGVTTYIDGVPQLNANASSIEFTGIEQVEFVRGPQSALFGRNALGGVINIASEKPSLAEWGGNLYAPFGNFATREIRTSASGPLTDRLALGFSFGHSARDGFTVNDVTGNDVDFRSATFGKAQALWTPSKLWETRVIVSGERARDGDYALGDLEAVRDNPFHVAHDFEGHTDRDVFNTTIHNRYEGGALSLTSTTGFVNWSTEDETDLDYTPFPAAVRRNNEEAFQFTQEVRVASPAAAPVALSPDAAIKWQAGLFFFSQNYDQNAVNSLAPFTIPQIPQPLDQTSPLAELDDRGFGLYGQGTLTLNSNLDVTFAGRFDHERKQALLESFYTPPLIPGSVVDAEESFSNFSPQVSVAYRFQPDAMAYASVGSGYKAGGFNPASPPGSEGYDEEHTLNVEGGIKSTWAGGRVLANATLFFIDWSDLQLNLPNPFVPAQYYIANVDGASSRGIELELTARPTQGLDVFSSFGYARARFDDGTQSSGADVSGNRLPIAPEYTFNLGAQFSHALTNSLSLYGRGELTAYGSFHYDDLNREEQEAYSLANFRAGVRTRLVFGEVWIKNAFDTKYVPLAFPYPGLAPSGFVGEAGRPRTYGVSGGLTF
jgi:iron complex outermembrane recepter protein